MKNGEKTAESAVFRCRLQTVYWPAVPKLPEIFAPGKVQTVGLPEVIHDARGLWVWPEHVEFGTPKTPSDLRRRSVGGAMQKYVLAHGFGRVQDTRMGLSVGGASRQGLSRKPWFVHAGRRPAAWHSAAGKAKNG